MVIRLRNTRLKRGLTQKQLAEEVRISDRTVGALERGRIKGSVDVWDRIETALGEDQRVLRQIDKGKS